MHIRIETSRTSDGNMSPRWGGAESVAAHRATFLAQSGFDVSQLILCRIPEPNGRDVVEVYRNDAGKEISADALITRGPAVLGLLTADCLPVVMHDPKTRYFAIAHCGWKSTGLRLGAALVDTFVSRGSAPQDIRAYIGPSIHVGSYARPLAGLAQRDDPLWQPFIVRKGDVAHIDLHGYLRSQFSGSGVRPEQVTAHPSDTYTDSGYFSHRRAQETGEVEGRMLTICSDIGD